LSFHSNHLIANQLYWNLKDSLITAEMILLRVLRFETNVELAYSHIPIVLDHWKYLMHGNMSHGETEGLLEKFRRILSNT
jgi:hypothetical protein